MNVGGVKHCRLFVIFCKFFNNRFFEVHSVFPITIHTSTDKHNQSWLQLTFVVYLWIVKHIHDWWVIAIRKTLSTEVFIEPIGFLIKKYHFQKSSSNWSLIDKSSLCGKLGSEAYFIDTAGRHCHDDIVCFHGAAIFAFNQAFILMLDHFWNIEFQLYWPSSWHYLLSKIGTHMLGSKFGLCFLKPILNVDQIVKILWLIDIV